MTSASGVPPQPGRTVAMVIVSSLLGLGLLTGLAAVLVYNNWNGNIQVAPIDGQLDNRPPKPGVNGAAEPLNILVLGSDTRDGDNNIDGLTGDGERSDLTMVVHLSADRTFAYGISIPRDTLVDRPPCKEPDGTRIPGASGAMWNAAFTVGGAACTVQQFEQVTGIRIDNYVVIDFTGFTDMVDALGGVEVCIPADIDDEEHDITLRAGTRELDGNESLAYVRVRNIGLGTDPERIKRQQAFMASMINKAVSRDMLAQPNRLVAFVNAMTSSLRTDFETMAAMARVGRTLQGIGLDNIKFVTTPWAESPRQEGRIEWTADVDRLWRLVLDDRPLSQEFLDVSISAGGPPPRSGGGSPDGTAEGHPGAAGPGERTREQGLSDDARAQAQLCT